jgi:short-subunit dehydrogenase
MTDKKNEEFQRRYGPWAIIVGASEGLGECAADELAARGLNLILVARNGPRLDAMAAELRNRHAIEARALAVDLTTQGTADRIVGAVADLEVGLLLYTTGAVHNADLFLDQPIALPLRMIQINCTMPVALIHGLAPAMRKRGRGGIVLVGSMGSFVGGPHMAAYSASKAFQVNLMEGLWAELGRDGVDILEAVIGSTDTPGRTRTLGVAFNPALDMTSQEVALEIIENIANGPTRVIAKIGTSGTGPLVKPWSEFRRLAVNQILGAMQSFTKRTTDGGH